MSSSSVPLRVDLVLRRVTEVQLHDPVEPATRACARRPRWPGSCSRSGSRTSFVPGVSIARSRRRGPTSLSMRYRRARPPRASVEPVPGCACSSTRDAVLPHVVLAPGRLRLRRRARARRGGRPSGSQPRGPQPRAGRRVSGIREPAACGRSPAPRPGTSSVSRPSAGEPSGRSLLRRSQRGEDLRPARRRAGERLPVEAVEAEARAVALLPLEVVEERPVEVARRPRCPRRARAGWPRPARG